MEPPALPEDVVLERLVKGRHLIRDFSSGDEKMDNWLRRHAVKNARFGYGVTYVAVRPGDVRPGDVRVWGFYSLSAGAIDASDLTTSDGSPSHISVALLGRIATEQSLQGRGFGEMLLIHALGKALEASRIIGVHGVLLDAKNERLVRWYSKYGFESIPKDRLRMFMSIATFEKGLAP